MRIYTRTGDDGTTALLGAGRVAKSALRVEAYGSVDELNAALGATRALDTGGWLRKELETIQAHLFQVGAELATAPGTAVAIEKVADQDTATLERWIDRLEDDLPPLASFVLPGGSPLAAQLHVTRTVCRRAERRLVAMFQGQAAEERLVRYLNRLGDLLFVMARWCNWKAGVPEIEWPGEPDRDVAPAG